MLARRSHHRASFDDVVSVGLFDIHVFTGLARVDGGESMPVVGSSNDQRVDGRIIDCFAVVADPSRLAAHAMPNLLQARAEHVGVDVTNVFDVDFRQRCENAEQPAASPLDTHHADGDAVVGCR